MLLAPTFVIAWSEATKQSSRGTTTALDCFALLAMTGGLATAERVG